MNVLLGADSSLIQNGTSVVEPDMDAQTEADLLKLKQKCDSQGSRGGFIKRGSSRYTQNRTSSRSFILVFVGIFDTC